METAVGDVMAKLRLMMDKEVDASKRGFLEQVIWDLEDVTPNIAQIG